MLYLLPLERQGDTVKIKYTKEILKEAKRELKREREMKARKLRLHSQLCLLGTSGFEQPASSKTFFKDLASRS